MDSSVILNFIHKEVTNKWCYATNSSRAHHSISSIINQFLSERPTKVDINQLLSKQEGVLKSSFAKRKKWIKKVWKSISYIWMRPINSMNSKNLKNHKIECSFEAFSSSKWSRTSKSAWRAATIEDQTQVVKWPLDQGKQTKPSSTKCSRSTMMSETLGATCRSRSWLAIKMITKDLKDR